MKKILIILAILVLIFPTIILAAHQAETCDEYCAHLQDDSPWDPPADQACICNPLQAAEFEVILDNIIGFIFNIAVVLAPLMIIIAGFLFITAAGDTNKITQARSIIIWTAVGFLIILLARGIMGIIMNLLGVS